LNIVTTYAWTGSAYVPSATAKAGVLAMTRSLAVEWAKYGIRTNAIAQDLSLLKVLGTDYFLVI
jgi:NAD(P)-dependent dehydrogenase (short-subunit alcohol dehydrogenase family)